MRNRDHIALYLRLSMSDGDLGKDHKDESNSIESQRMLLKTYVADHPELSGELREYVDDGYTGTNFERPGFHQMIEDARKGNIQVILVKDLSRLGRDYIGVGDYIEQIFPILGVRFIAVNNNFDSSAYSDGAVGLDLAVSNLINSLYSRDVSKKIRSAFEVRWRQGYATATRVPFGYQWNTKKKGEWVIDPVASKYVRRIFDLALEGMNTAQISLRLNEEKIPTAGVYESHQTEDCSWNPIFIAPDSEQLWTAAKVWRILRSYEYTGALVMGKKKVLALGSKTYRSVPKSEQVIFENAHEAIVSHEEFELAQMAIRKMGGQGYMMPKKYPLKGKVACGNCKRRLEYAERVGGAVLFCPHKRQAGKYSKCCGDNFSEAMINARVGYAIRQMLKMVNFLKGETVHTMTVEMPDVGKVTRELEQVQAEQVRQYEAYADGVISREQYIKKKQELSRKATELQTALDLADGIKEEEENNSDALKEIADQGQTLCSSGRLTREMVYAFIEKVYVYDTNKVEVVFQCEDVILAALDQYEERRKGSL